MRGGVIAAAVLGAVLVLLAGSEGAVAYDREEAKDYAEAHALTTATLDAVDQVVRSEDGSAAEYGPFTAHESVTTE